MTNDTLRRLQALVAEGAPDLQQDLETLRLLALGPRLNDALLGPPVTFGSDVVDDPTAEAVFLPSGGSPDRYVDLGLIGRGGMGEVRRVRDRELNRVVAMKRLRLDGEPSATIVARFVEEVQTTAQLQHPNIVPVYDAGRAPDGRVYFTMKEVQGRTLRDVIRDLHAASADRWSTSPSGWTFRRLVAALHQVSLAVSYAHDRGVLHRDLKPANVMVGAFGEVLVMDWGLAKVLGRAELPGERVVVDSSRDATRWGHAIGTPAYMSPEQARGEHDRIDVRADVYALGAMLYEVLTGLPPYRGATGMDVVFQVVTAAPPPPRRPVPWRPDTPEGVAPAADSASPSGELELPVELVVACTRALARDPDARFPSVAEFAAELEAWLDGSRRRDQALEVVARASAALPAAQELRARAEALAAEAEAELAAVPTWMPEETKLAGWAKQGEAAALLAQADLRMLERDQLLAGALTHVPDLAEAHAALAEDLRERHAAAERERDSAQMTRAETLLRAHLGALPESHPTRVRSSAYLRGTGAVTLVTEPPGAHVELLRYEPHGRRLVARPVRDFGRTPLVEVPLEMGSYLLVLRAPGRAEVRYPVHLARGAHWDGVRPGSREPYPIHLPLPGELGPDDCYVPAGWFVAGGRGTYGALPPDTRLWCDPFVLRRFPVTNRDYLGFLDDLVARGREEEASRWQPRQRAGAQVEVAAPIYGRDDAGRFVLRPDADGDVWLPDYPVVQIDWSSADAYARWAAERTGLAWRLPGELEWEKAARGVDGRLMPWGDGFDPCFCNMRQSRPDRPLPAVVDSFPLDESVYGVRGLGGNVQDWCEDVATKAGPPLPDRIVRPFGGDVPASGQTRRIRRGGLWDGVSTPVRSAWRAEDIAALRYSALGFRLARGLDGPAPTRR